MRLNWAEPWTMNNEQWTTADSCRFGELENVPRHISSPSVFLHIKLSFCFSRPEFVSLVQDYISLHLPCWLSNAIFPLCVCVCRHETITKKASCGYLLCQTEWNIIFKLWGPQIAFSQSRLSNKCHYITTHRSWWWFGCRSWLRHMQNTAC